MRPNQYWIDERAFHLAAAHLLRNETLIVEDYRTRDLEAPFDLMVWLKKNEGWGGRCFGILVKGLKSQEQVRRISDDTVEIQINLKNLQALKDLPFPLYLFVFSMSDDSGYYKKLKNGIPASKSDESNRFQVLDKQAVDAIIEEINNLYEGATKIPA